MQAKGVLFKKDWGPNRMNVEVLQTPTSLEVMGESGTFSMPFSDMQIEFGGANGKMLYCRHDSLPGTVLIIDDGRFIFHLSHTAPPQIREAIAQLKTEKRALFLRVLVWGCVAILSIFVLLWLGRGLVEKSVDLIPFSVDETIGEYADKQMAASVGVTVKDPVITDAIDVIVNRLAPHTGLAEGTFKVKVIESDQVNAYALPGGYLVIYTGLIAEAGSAEEVAAVIGHEMAHVTERHGLRRVVGSVGLIGVVQIFLGDAAGLAVAVRDLFTLAAINGYSRDQEMEADLEGVRLLIAAKVSPDGAIRFFERMKENQSSLESSGLFEWVSTHPDHSQRIAELEIQMSGLGRIETKPFDLDWEKVKSRIAPSPAPEKTTE